MISNKTDRAITSSEFLKIQEMIVAKTLTVLEWNEIKFKLVSQNLKETLLNVAKYTYGNRKQAFYMTQKISKPCLRS